MSFWTRKTCSFHINSTSLKWFQHWLKSPNSHLRLEAISFQLQTYKIKTSDLLLIGNSELEIEQTSPFLKGEWNQEEEEEEVTDSKGAQTEKCQHHLLKLKDKLSFQVPLSGYIGTKRWIPLATNNPASVDLWGSVHTAAVFSPNHTLSAAFPVCCSVLCMLYLGGWQYQQRR